MGTETSKLVACGGSAVAFVFPSEFTSPPVTGAAINYSMQFGHLVHVRGAVETPVSRNVSTAVPITTSCLPRAERFAPDQSSFEYVNSSDLSAYKRLAAMVGRCAKDRAGLQIASLLSRRAVKANAHYPSISLISRQSFTSQCLLRKDSIMDGHIDPSDAVGRDREHDLWKNLNGSPLASC